MLHTMIKLMESYLHITTTHTYHLQQYWTQGFQTDLTESCCRLLQTQCIWYVASSPPASVKYLQTLLAAQFRYPLANTKTAIMVISAFGWYATMKTIMKRSQSHDSSSHHHDKDSAIQQIFSLADQLLIPTLHDYWWQTIYQQCHVFPLSDYLNKR